MLIVIHIPMALNRKLLVYIFIQQWYGSLERSPVVHDYIQFKTTFEYEQYLDILSFNLRCFFYKI